MCWEFCYNGKRPSFKYVLIVWNVVRIPEWQRSPVSVFWFCVFILDFCCKTNFRLRFIATASPQNISTGPHRAAAPRVQPYNRVIEQLLTAELKLQTKLKQVESLFKVSGMTPRGGIKGCRHFCHIHDKIKLLNKYQPAGFYRQMNPREIKTETILIAIVHLKIVQWVLQMGKTPRIMKEGVDKLFYLKQFWTRKVNL